MAKRRSKAMSPKKSSKENSKSKGDKSKSKDEAKKSAKINDRKFSRYIHKVLRQVFPEDITISSKAMVIFNDMMNDIFERLAKEASQLALIKTRNGRQKFTTLSSREIQTAVRLQFPGSFAYLFFSQ